MIKKLFPNQAAKEGKGFWSLDRNNFSFAFFYLLILFLPTQFGKHFWPNFSFIYGLRIDYLSPAFYFTDILVFLIFIFSIKDIIKRVLKKHKKKLVYFSIFLSFLLIGINGSKNPDAGYFSLFKFLEYIYLGIFVYFNFSKMDKTIIVKAIALSVLFECFLVVFQYLNQGSLNGIFYFFGERNFNQQTPGIANASINGSLILRPYGTFSHPNVLGGFMVIYILFLVSLKSKINKHFLSLVLISGTIGIFISLSRSAIAAWVLFCLAFFVLMIFEKYKKDRLNPRVFSYKNALVGLIVFIFLFLFINSFAFKRLIDLTMSDQSVVQRSQLINSSLEMIYKNPVFGVGLNNFLNNLKTNFNSPILIQPVHNIFLLTFAQTGIVGVLLFIYLFFVAIIKNIKFNKKNIYKLAIVSSIIFLGSFDHYFLTSQQGQLILSIIFPYLLLNKI